METTNASWHFTVACDENGDVHTDWLVVDFDEEVHSGRVQGPLHEALLGAYDALGLVCPLMYSTELHDLAFINAEDHREE